MTEDSPETVVDPTPIETEDQDSVLVGQWVLSIVDSTVKYGHVVSIVGDDALIKTRDDDDQIIRVPYSSLTRSESGHR